MSTWHVTITVAADDGATPDETALDHFLELLNEDAPVSVRELVAGSAIVTGTPEEPVDGKARYGADISLDDDGYADLPHIVGVAQEIFRTYAGKAGLPDWPLASLTVLSDAELDAELAESAFPSLVGVSEVADLLKVTKQRVSTLAKSETFPDPVARLESGPIWTVPSVRRFVENWTRRPGRPPRSA